MSINEHLIMVPATEADDEEALERHMEDEGLYLGKSWQALHWILAGGDFFAESAISGGEPIDGIDHGSAPPPQLVRQDDVARFATELDAMTEARVRELFDIEAMKADGVWPANPDIEELVLLAAEVCAFYKTASAERCAVLQVWS